MDRVIAYVDGFNLYFGMKSKGWRRFYWLDIPELVRKMLKPSQQLVETKYFTSRVSASFADPDKPKRQNTYLEAIGTLPSLSVFFGHYLQTSTTCRTCGASRLVQSEKMTDVNIATQLLADAFLDRFDTAFLISGDSDLVPPVKLIRQVFPRKWIAVAFPPGRYSKWLANEAKGNHTTSVETRLRPVSSPILSSSPVVSNFAVPQSGLERTYDGSRHSGTSRQSETPLCPSSRKNLPSRLTVPSPLRCSRKPGGSPPNTRSS